MQFVEELEEHAAKEMGYTALWDKQREAILGFLCGRGVFVPLPTGSGKSLCYSILPLVFDRLKKKKKATSIVIVLRSLISLMKEQPHSLERKGMKAKLVKCCVLVSVCLSLQVVHNYTVNTTSWLWASIWAAVMWYMYFGHSVCKPQNYQSWNSNHMTISVIAYQTHMFTEQEFPDLPFRVPVMQYIQRCGNRRVWSWDYVHVCLVKCLQGKVRSLNLCVTVRITRTFYWISLGNSCIIYSHFYLIWKYAEVCALCGYPCE